MNLAEYGDDGIGSKIYYKFPWHGYVAMQHDYLAMQHGYLAMQHGYITGRPPTTLVVLFEIVP